MRHKRIAVVILILLFNLVLYFLGYEIPRSSFYVSLTCYSLLFVGYFFIYKLFDERRISLKNILLISLLSRLVLIGAVPQLSDDYNRFIWDGHLIVNHIDPYEFTPAEVLEKLPQHQRTFFSNLYEDLNSPHYYSIYPISNQLVFAASAYAGGENVRWNIYCIRIILIAFELLTICILFYLIKQLKLPSKRVFLYALNPLVLIEITGNLHFEGIMLCFLLMAIYFLSNNKYVASGFTFGLAVAVKLTPVILIPAFYKYLKRPFNLKFIFVAMAMVAILFLPILHMGSFTQFFQSIRLYHGVFEFNASVYYVLRYLGILIFQNNLINILSPLLSALTIYIIVKKCWTLKIGSMQGLLGLIIFSYLIFYLLNTVVHPWYLITGLGISVLTTKKSFLVWSYLIFLSYFTYRTTAYDESTILLFVEYVVLLAMMGWDYRRWDWGIAGRG